MKKRSKKGFTLIELIVVIAIIGILAAILIPTFTGFQERAKATQALVDAKQVATAFDGLMIEKGSYGAVTKADVVTLSGVADAKITTFEGEAAGADGGFIVTVTVATGKTVTAGRLAGNDALGVRMDPK